MLLVFFFRSGLIIVCFYLVGKYEVVSDVLINFVMMGRRILSELYIKVVGRGLNMYDFLVDF